MFDVILQLGVNAIIIASTYALIAIGLSFIYTTTRVFHLAHGVTVILSGYVFWWFWERADWHPVLAALVACAAGVLFGLLVNEFIYEPLRGRQSRGLVYLFATIAVLEFGTAGVLAVFGSQPRSFGILTTVHDIAGTRISSLQIGIASLAVFLLIATWVLVKKTKFGEAMRATADNEMVAEILGVRTRLIRRLTLAIGSFLGAVAGIMTAIEYNLEPNAGVYLVIKGFTAMVIGGVGSMAGALFGSLVLGVAEQGAVWFWGAGWKNAVAFILLFLFLLLRPHGIFGRKKSL